MIIYNTGDKFLEREDCYHAHFISADFYIRNDFARALNSKYHIVKWFERRYGLNWHKDVYHYYMDDGVCLVDKFYKLFHLIVAERYWAKPTKESMKNALSEMAIFCKRYNIDKVEIAKTDIGKKVSWEYVEDTIEEIFDGYSIQIYICNSLLEK